MLEAIKRIGEIDRARCRKVAEERFSPDRMADEYVEVYRRLCGTPDYQRSTLTTTSPRFDVTATTVASVARS